MGEYFGKYQDARRSETASTLDDPVIFLGGFTKGELGVGLVILIGGIYLLEISWLLTLLIAPSAYPVMKLLRFMRERLPPNFFNQFGWFYGLMNKGLERHIRRPAKSYLTK